jgi:hypothetical protein
MGVAMSARDKLKERLSPLFVGYERVCGLKKTRRDSDEVVDLIIQAAVEEVRAELKSSFDSVLSKLKTRMYSVKEVSAAALAEFINKGVEK